MILFEKLKEYAEQTPNKVAVKDLDSMWTYRDFYKLVLNLAEEIKEKIGTHKRVLVQLDHSKLSILAPFSILLSENIYVPIRKKITKQEMSYFLKETHAALCITDVDNEKSEIPFINVFKDLDYLSQKQPNSKILAHSYVEDDIAYILHTSGTTGDPKGVCVTYKNLNYIINIMYKLFPARKKTTYLFSTPVTFDVSISEIFPWVISGGTVVCLNLKDMNNYKNFVNLVIANKITHVAFSPSGFLVLMQNIGNKGLKKLDNILEYVLLGGEIFNPKIQFKWIEAKIRKTKLFNMYGPTETTVYATYYQVPNYKLQEIPIGKPLPGAKCLLQKVKDNKYKLLIGGNGLSKGYLNTNLNRGHFVEHDGMKYYDSGDLVTQDSFHNYLYRGREDNQIQIHGIRVELEEIERNLQKIPLIKEAVVLYQNHSLNAALVIKGTISNNEYLPQIRKNIVRYMQPNKYIIYDHFPLTVNNKIDRKKIENDFISLSKKDDGKSIPLKYQFITDLIADSLNISAKKISFMDDYFEIGGDSLSVIELVLLINKKLRLEIDPDTIYELRSINKISKYINELCMNNGANSESQDVLTNKERTSIVNMLKAENLRPLSLNRNKLKIRLTLHSQRIYYYTHYKKEISFVTKISNHSLSQVERAVDNLIKDQSVLRSIILEKQNNLFFQEYGEGPQVPVVYLNKDYLFVDSEDPLFSSIYEKIFANRYSNGFLYSFVIIKCRKSIYLISVFDHTIFDGASITIVKNVLNSNLNSQPLEKSQSYFKYIELVKKENNHNYLGNNLLEKEILNKSFESIRNINKKSNTITRIPCSFTKDNVTGMIMAGYMIGQKLLKKSHNQQLLLKFVVNGRNYSKENFKNTLGDFHGSVYVPIKLNYTLKEFRKIFFRCYKTQCINSIYRPGYILNKRYPEHNNALRHQLKLWNSQSFVSINFIGSRNINYTSKMFDAATKSLNKINNSLYYLSYFKDDEIIILGSKYAKI